MVKEELSKTLKSMTLGELAEIFYPNEKDIIENINIMKEDEETIFYTIRDILEKYPFFTRYSLNKAIQSGGLPSCIVGKQRMFNKEEVEKWLEKETSPKAKKIKYDIWMEEWLCIIKKNIYMK